MNAVLRLEEVNLGKLRARLLEMASGVRFSEGLGPVFYCLMAPEKV